MSQKNSRSNELDQLTLSELMAKLDEIVDWFNQADIDIDQATAKFEEGVKLAEIIKEKLRKTDNKINQIKLRMTEIDKD